MAATSFLIHPQLGQFPFIRLTLPPPGRRFHGLVEARPGVNGYSFWKEAARGIPWRSESIVDTLDRQTGLAVCRQYEYAPFNGVWSIVWENLLVPIPLAVVVLNVGDFQVNQMVNCVGGLNPLSRATVRAVWTFLAV